MVRYFIHQPKANAADRYRVYAADQSDGETLAELERLMHRIGQDRSQLAEEIDSAEAERQGIRRPRFAARVGANPDFDGGLFAGPDSEALWDGEPAQLVPRCIEATRAWAQQERQALAEAVAERALR